MKNIYYIIAPGLSFKDVTDEEWEFLKDKNTMTFSRVPLGGKKTKYFFSIERHSVDRDMIDYIYELGHTDTKMLLSIQESIRYAKEKGFIVRKIVKGNFYYMPSRRPWFVGEDNPPNTLQETLAKNFHQPLFRFRGQLTAILNASIILGAEEIRLIGCDFTSQKAFYDDLEYMKTVCKSEDAFNRLKKFNDQLNNELIPNVYKHNKDYNPKVQHSSDMVRYDKNKYGDKGVRGIRDVVQWLDKSWREDGASGIYVTNKISTLYKENGMEYKGIMDE